MISLIKNKIKFFLIAIGFLTVALAAPVVPQELNFKYAYDYPCAFEKAEELANKAVSPTSTPKNKAGYRPDCTGGIVYVAAFTDKVNKITFIEIPEEQYRNMGRKGGASFNPKKTQYDSLISSFIQPAEAAIARNNLSDGSAAGTSLTVAHTSSSGSDRLLAVFVFNQGDTTPTPTDISDSGVTYDGTAMTRQIKLANATNDAVYGFTIPDQSTGVNNIVVTRADSTGTVWLGAMDYTGVGDLDGTDSDAIVSNTLTHNITIGTDNSWGMAGSYNPEGIATSAGTNLVEHVTPSTWIAVGDSNTDLASGSTTFTWTRSGGGSQFIGVVFTFAPVVAVSVEEVSNSQVILIGI